MSLETSTPSLDQLVREAKALLDSNPSSEDMHKAIAKVFEKHDEVNTQLYFEATIELFSQVKAEKRASQPTSTVSRTLSRRPISFVAHTAAATERTEDQNYENFQFRSQA